MSDVRERIHRLGLLDPTDPEVLQRRTLAPRLAEIRGKVGGFLDNRKHNASALLQHMATRLSAEYGMAEAMYQAKFIYSRVAAPLIVEDMAGRCDFVVTAIGD
jgi:hypothetical protein